MTAPDARVLAALLERVARGDRAAFRALYDASAAKLFGTCLRILGEREQAEDVLQEVYLTIWRRAGTFEAERGGASAWLASIARNRAIDRLRQTRAVSTDPIHLAEQVADAAPLASDRIELRDEEARLRALVDQLDPGDAQLIRAAFYEGSTYVELANRAAAPLGTVKSRIRRALLKLRARLQ